MFENRALFSQVKGYSRGKLMRNFVYKLFIATFVAIVSLSAAAQENAAAQQNRAAYDAVNSALEQGAAPATIIAALTEYPFNMDLSEATVFAMVAGGDENRLDFVSAGVKSAGNLPQAQSVVNAVRAAAGQTSAEANAATEALSEYMKTMPQPKVYQDDYTPTGGGASPAF